MKSTACWNNIFVCQNVWPAMSYMSDTASHAIFQLNRFKAYGATVDKIAHCPLTRGTALRTVLRVCYSAVQRPHIHPLELCQCSFVTTNSAIAQRGLRGSTSLLLCSQAICRAEFKCDD